MVSVATGDTVWALWPQRALWVPTGTPYRIYDRDSATIFELSLDRVGDLPSATRLVIVSPLFRELIIEEDRLMADGREGGEHASIHDLPVSRLRLEEGRVGEVGVSPWSNRWSAVLRKK